MLPLTYFSAPHTLPGCTGTARCILGRGNWNVLWSQCWVRQKEGASSIVHAVYPHHDVYLHAFRTLACTTACAYTPIHSPARIQHMCAYAFKQTLQYTRTRVRVTLCYNNPCGAVCIARYAINPARDLAPRTFAYLAGFGAPVFPPSWWWIPSVAPVVGGILGGGLYEVLVGFHHPGRHV